MTQSHKSPAEIETEIRDLTRQLEAASQGALQRIDCNAETIEQGLAKLVLGLIELLRRLLERQAIRRMEGGSLFFHGHLFGRLGGERKIEDGCGSNVSLQSRRCSKHGDVSLRLLVGGSSIL